MDLIEIVEICSSKIEDSATKDAAIQTTEIAEEKQNDKGIYNWFALTICSPNQSAPNISALRKWVSMLL